MPESTSTPAQTLAKVQIFSGLTESELSFLAQRAAPRNYSAGQSVFGEGEPCSGLYVVESGTEENSMPLDMPEPVAEYLVAEKAKDADALSRCFTEDGTVHDEGPPL